MAACTGWGRSLPEPDLALTWHGNVLCTSGEFDEFLLFFYLQNASAQAALQAAQALSGNMDTQGEPHTVLRVIVEHMIYPVTLEILYQVRQSPRRP